MTTRFLPASLLGALLCTMPLAAQDAAYTLEVDPPALTLAVGDTLPITARVVDPGGLVQDAQIVFFGRPRRWVDVAVEEATPAQTVARVTAHKPGTYSVIVMRPDTAGNPLRVDVPLTVEHLPVDRLTFVDAPGHVYAGTTVPFTVKAYDRAGFELTEPALTLSTSDPAVGTGYAGMPSFARAPSPQRVDITSGLR